MIGSLVKTVVVLAVIAAGALGYYMYANNLNPLDTDDLKKAVTSTRSRFDNIQDAVKAAGDGGETVIYKRKDKNGNWYYTNEPPEEGEQSEKLIYRSDTNVLPDPTKPDANR
ncbi:MAG: hypothetical protein PVF34_01000 [Gammaproteobacteria bacterium]|jgi:hypothetical protein